MQKLLRLLFIVSLILVAASAAQAQGFRIGDSQSVSSALTTPGVISTVSNSTINVCSSPANAVPCTNKATTYTSVTLGTPCSTSTQVVLAGTSTCVATTDTRGNWGAWVAAGNYDWTVTLSTGQSFGPFSISAGNPSATNLVGPGTVTGNYTHSGAETFANLNGIRVMDGVKYALTGVGLASALADAGTGGTVMIPPNTTVAVDTTTPIAITLGQQSIFCVGQGSNISYSGAGNLFNVTGQEFTMKDCRLTGTSIVSRAAVSTFNLVAGGNLGKLQNLTFIGAAAINNGRVFNGDLAASGTGEWLLEHLRIQGGGTWTGGIFLRTSTGTISGFTLNDIISFSGVTYTDALYVFDTGVDSAKIANSENGSTGTALNIRNSLAGQAPRWIHCTDCRLEAGGSATANPVVKIDDVRDFKYEGGYVASGQNGFVVNGGNQIVIHNTEIVNIGQHCVLAAAPAVNWTFSTNTLEDCGISANNSFDYFNVPAVSQDFHIDGNHFRQLNANKARYGVNVLVGASNFYSITNNDFASAAIGTAYINDLGTGVTKWTCGNGIAGNVCTDPLGLVPHVIASGTAAMTTAGIATVACGTTVTVAATGALTTDTINISHNAAVTAANGGILNLNAWPTAGNVNFNYCNPSATNPFTPTAMTINWNVTR